MKNYSSKRAKKGKLAYRTPSRFILKQFHRHPRLVIETSNLKLKREIKRGDI